MLVEDVFEEIGLSTEAGPAEVKRIIAATLDSKAVEKAVAAMQDFVG
jgi:hypothetical protein